ncbi:MAG: histidinol-phosphate transaminase [Gemmatimonadales bacterium]
MSLTRRSFLRGVGGSLAAVPLVSGRGFEAAWGRRPATLPAGDLIRIDSNENPNGPAPATLAAIRDALAEAGRYPRRIEPALVEAIAGAHGVSAANILLGAGSTEHLRFAVDVFAARDAGLLTAAPSFEVPASQADLRGFPVVRVPVDRRLGLDLDAMLDRAPGAGLVYFCNPNNPTGTVHGRRDAEAFVRRLLARAPQATVLVDEAYFEYVDDPDYGTLIPLAMTEPRVVVLRTMSKVHGMAGLRVGYAVAAAGTIARLEPHRVPQGVNVLGAAGAIAALADAEAVERERRRNREVRAYTRRYFEKRGFTVAHSATNFLMVAIDRRTEEFAAACASRGVAVGRVFPPLVSHARISIGTMEEMRRATTVFDEVFTARAGSR